MAISRDRDPLVTNVQANDCSTSVGHYICTKVVFVVSDLVEENKEISRATYNCSEATFLDRTCLTWVQGCEGARVRSVYRCATLGQWCHQSTVVKAQLSESHCSHRESDQIFES